MRWEHVVIYAVGALMFIGVAASVFQLYGAAIVVGCILIVCRSATARTGSRCCTAT